ncbi:MAG: DUF368 domain-containing protein [Phycisphaerales bacterium]
MGHPPESDQRPPEREDDAASRTSEDALGPGLLARAAIGGVLMGLANLVPGISGGTMLVATGVYRRFIDGVSDLTRLRFRMDSIVLVGVIVLAALAAIVSLSSVVSGALVHFRWGMYALFIGLTLGGAPVLVRMGRPFTPAVWGGLVAGALAMAGVVVAQEFGGGGGGASTNAAILVVAGAAGASAMILPGISGAYLLLILGQYRPILDAIGSAKDAAVAGDVGGVIDQMHVIVPVGIGVVLGVVVVTNVLRVVFHKFEKATVGVLLGLLLAAPLGLYPFKEGVAPEVGSEFRGQVVTEETLHEIKPKDWDEAYFTPSVWHVLGALGMAALGFGATLGVAHLGREKDVQGAD